MALVLRFGSRGTNMQGRDADNRQTVSSNIAMTNYNTPARAGGYSIDQITALCDSALLTTIVETNMLRSFGIASVVQLYDASQLLAGIEFTASATYRVLESNSQKATGSYTASDIFEVCIENTSTTAVVKYYRTPFATGVRASVYTSTITAATIAGWFPLFFGIAIGSNGTIDQAKMTGTYLIQPSPAMATPSSARRGPAMVGGSAVATAYGQYF